MWTSSFRVGIIAVIFSIVFALLSVYNDSNL
jgi:hypothetical protein